MLCDFKERVGKKEHYNCYPFCSKDVVVYVNYCAFQE